MEGRTYKTDDWYNTPSTILDAIPRRLHLQADHPLTITRKLIESRFPHYTTHNDLFPVVTTAQNFDSLGFPLDHVGRSQTDTYYINKDTVLRTHTSAHQADTFQKNESAGYLISADVYRRDEIDRSHYPVFHQMEGARTWDRQQAGRAGKSVAEVIWEDVEKLPKHDIAVEDPNPPFHIERNPLQSRHAPEEAEAVAAHLKRSLEDMVVTIFNAARSATDATSTDEPLQVRWVEAYFPFTSPSWELEVYWQGDWLEVLGCGVVSQPILDNASVPERVGWAFGIGLERIAMLLYSIPDIRLFWSKDTRFLSQFSEAKPAQKFVPFSKYPVCFKDIAFWLRSSSSAAGGAAQVLQATPITATAEPNKSSHSQSQVSDQPVIASTGSHAGSGSHMSAAPSTHVPESVGVATSPASPPSGSKPEGANETLIPPAAPVPAPYTFHENDVMELAREVCGNVVEDVRLIDEFTHPKTGRRSMCYRINYRSLERSLTTEEANAMHEQLGSLLVDRLGVELR